jgi:predicted amidohydrolase
MSKIRVCAAQFGVVADTSENLNRCLKMIDEAAQHSPAFIVLPEFCNYLPIAESVEKAASVALETDHTFLKQIGAKALVHGCYIKINVTLKNGSDKPTISNLLYSPSGKLVGRADRQILQGPENDIYSAAKKSGDVVNSDYGKIGMLCGADSFMMETARQLTVRGARFLLNSVATFATDMPDLHIPARAAENGVFEIAACNIGNILPPDSAATLAEDLKCDERRFQGIGGSQIVSPDGVVLARAGSGSEEIITTEIETEDSIIADSVIRYRKPELYKPISRQPAPRDYKPGAKTLRVAISQSYNALRNIDAPLIVFPELCFFTNGVVSNLDRAVQVSTQMVGLISVFVSGTGKHVVTSLVEKVGDGFAHVGVVINKTGIVFRQHQLHGSPRLPWVSSLGTELDTFDLPFGRIALMVGDDSRSPEIFRLAAYRNVEIAVCPDAFQKRWESEFGLPERCAENRMNIVAATRPNPELGQFGTSVLATNDSNLTLWKERQSPFEGKVNYPRIQRAGATQDVFYGEISPADCGNRMLAPETDLVDGRLFSLLRPLTK